MTLPDGNTHNTSTTPEPLRHTKTKLITDHIALIKASTTSIILTKLATELEELHNKTTPNHKTDPTSPIIIRQTRTKYQHSATKISWLDQQATS
jgi:hypothetical protein